MRYSSLIAFTVMTLCSFAIAADTTYVNGDVYDEAWTSANSPYVVTTTIHILIELEIDPNVEVFFNENVQLIVDDDVDLRVDGESWGGVIKMKSRPGQGDWRGIRFAGRSDSHIKFAEISDAYADAGGSGNDGGAIYMNNASCYLDIENTTISDCNALDDGGAIFIGNGYLDLDNVDIEDCHAADEGGAIAMTGGDLDIFSTTIIRDNDANDFGGGIYVSGGSIDAEYCLIANNTTDYGGGIYVCGGTTLLDQVTIAGNYAEGYGGGIYRQYSGTVTLDNSIVYDNYDGNLTGSYTYSCDYCCIESGSYSGSGNFSSDPDFQDATNYQFDYSSPCVDASSTGSWIGYHQDVTRPALAAPSPFALDQNSPNPFNPSTTIRFSVPSEGMVNLCVYSVTGQLVRTLVNAEVSSGQHEVAWNGTDMNNRAVASGVYLYRITTAQGVITQRMTLTR